MPTTDREEILRRAWARVDMINSHHRTCRNSDVIDACVFMLFMLMTAFVFLMIRCLIVR